MKLSIHNLWLVAVGICTVAIGCPAQTALAIPNVSNHPSVHNSPNLNQGSLSLTTSPHGNVVANGGPQRVNKSSQPELKDSAPVHSGRKSLVITSDSQQLQQLPNNQIKSVFNGHVYMVYNSTTQMNAQSVVVLSINGRKQVIATGNPVVIKDASRKFYLQSTKVTFDVNANLITAINAQVNYNGNILKSSLITYNLSTNNLSASGNKNSRVETIINNVNSPATKSSNK